MKLVLDTNIYCDFAKGIPTVVDALADYGSQLYLPAVVVAELDFGFIKETKSRENQERFQRIIEQLYFHQCFQSTLLAASNDDQSSGG